MPRHGAGPDPRVHDPGAVRRPGCGAAELTLRLLFDKRLDYKKGEFGQYHKPQGDVAEAKKLLGAAGQKDFKIDATFYTYATYDQQRAELLTEQFRQAGITLAACRADYTEFNSQWVGGRLAEATTSGWSAAG
ncbi:MAG: hypothetical protein FJ035_01725 [Chloroflexi bacterium]|nr:hypothetical protein [Chloroflexota bacterium]